jgi:hypothetical protein
MKIDKRITKCIIAATVLIAIFVTAPALSSASVALAQQPPKTAELTIENYVNAINHCSFAAEHCPQGSNTGMLTTITIASAPRSGLPPTKIEFPAGPWNKETILMPHPEIPIGSTYEITTKVPIPEYTFEDGHLPDHTFYVTFRHISSSIDGPCRAEPDKTAHCESTMGDGGATIKVTYNWSYAKA